MQFSTSPLVRHLKFLLLGITQAAVLFSCPSVLIPLKTLHRTREDYCGTQSVKILFESTRMFALLKIIYSYKCMYYCQALAVV